MYRYFLKRVFDFIVALVLLIFLSPLFLVTMIALWVVNRGNPFFIQRRPGKDGKIFNIIKFKTMSDRRDAEENLLPDAERLTKTGGIVRKTSLDEIPQLLNVIKGDMSLIGPRPLLEEYLPLYNMAQARRHEVRPGITGWAQVNGRNAISWEEKFKLDVWYVDNLSFSIDIMVLLKTIKKVFIQENINADGHVTIAKFTGNHDND